MAPRSSTIASITRSQSAKSASAVVVESEPKRCLALGSRHPLLVDLPLEEVCDPLVRGVAELVRHLAADRLVACFDRQLRDSGAHGAESHDTDATDLRDGHERAILPAAPTDGASGSAVVAAAAGDVVDPRIGARGVGGKRHENNDDCDEEQPEHDLMVQ